MGRFADVSGYLVILVAWIGALALFPVFWHMVWFVSSQYGLARAVAPNCSAILSCGHRCDIVRNFTSLIFGTLPFPECVEFRSGFNTDVLLLAIFGLQHALMATDSWKRLMSAFEPLERTVYVLATAFALQILVSFWIPLDIFSLWCLDTTQKPFLWWVFSVVHAFFWLVLLANLLIVDLAELIGIKPVHFRVLWNITPAERKSEDLNRLYRHMRHPGLVHGAVVIFFHPVMTFDRVLLGVSFVLFFLWRSQVDEKDIAYGNRMMTRKRWETSPIRPRR